ncbi:MAG: 7-cyano-7-deazaguanine synthase [Candidatus Geothermincolia bacterium]
MSTALVLLSGGMDSAACLFDAVARHGRESVVAVFFDWGQRTVGEERIASERLCEAAGLAPPVEIALNFPYSGLLTDPEAAVPLGRTPESIELEGVAPTFFPGRNLVMLSYAFGLAAQTGMGEIYFGANAQDEAGYPDCRGEFLERFAGAARAATESGIILVTPLIQMTKEQIVSMGDLLGVPWDDTFSCYAPLDGKPCGSCDACVLRTEALSRQRQAAPPRGPDR